MKVTFFSNMRSALHAPSETAFLYGLSVSERVDGF